MASDPPGGDPRRGTVPSVGGGRDRMVKTGQRLGRSQPSILRSRGQTGSVPDRRGISRQRRGGRRPGGRKTLFAGGLGDGPKAPPESGDSPKRDLSNQT